MPVQFAMLATKRYGFGLILRNFCVLLFPFFHDCVLPLVYLCMVLRGDSPRAIIERNLHGLVGPVSMRSGDSTPPMAKRSTNITVRMT